MVTRSPMVGVGLLNMITLMMDGEGYWDTLFIITHIKGWVFFGSRTKAGKHT